MDVGYWFYWNVNDGFRVLTVLRLEISCVNGHQFC